MKRNTLLLIALLGTTLAWSQTTRMILVEEFTQASCSPCAGQNPAFNALLDSNSATVIPLKYQVAWPGIDPMNAQNPAQVTSRGRYYDIEGVPDAVMDGNAFYGQPAQFTQQLLDAQAAVPASFEIDLRHWFNTADDTIFVYCQITATQNITLAQPRLRMALVEKTITFATPPGNNGERVFEQVMRKMYPTALGEPLDTVWVAGESRTITFAAPIPYYLYDHNEIAMVAWIQDDSDQNVKQAARSNAPSAPFVAAPMAAFTADVLTSCDGLVQFHDESTFFPSSYLWDFGDGQTSTDQHPRHQYHVDSTFSISLTVTNAHGTDVVFKSQYVEVTHVGAAPVGIDGLGCTGGQVQLSAVPQQGGDIIWQDGDGNVVGQGNHLVTTISGTSEYFASETMPNAVIALGIPNTIPGGSQYYNASTAHGLFFDVLAPCTLRSVDVDAGSAGNRTFLVINGNGDVVHSMTANVPPGYSTVNLGFDMEVGQQYLLKLAGPTIDMYRDVGGGLFPYQSPVLNITGGTSSLNPLTYYFFYNWQVQPRACQSVAAVVTAIDTCQATGMVLPELAIELSLSPNPNQGQFALQFETQRKADVTVTIRNACSQVVLFEELKGFKGMYRQHLDLRNSAKGLYFVTVTDGRGRLTRKVIVE